MSKERVSQPTCMYKVGPFGKTLSKTFDHPDEVPAGEGWVDSPAEVKPAAKAAKVKPAAKATKATKKAPAKRAPKARPAA